MSAGHKGNPSGCARGFGVHPRQAHSVTGELIDIGCFITPYGIQRFVAQIAKTDVINEYVENIGGLAVVFLAKLCQTFVEIFVLYRPALAVLLLQNVILCVMHNARSAGMGDVHRQGYNKQCFED
jgi:hypothetical protein